MIMLKLLVKKQLMEIFHLYFYNEKKGTKRSTIGVIGMFLFFFIVLFGILGSLFFGVSIVMIQAFHYIGLDWMYFSLMALASIMFGVVGSVFNTYSMLYLAKDNDLLFSLPIPSSTIILSRIVSVYVMSFLYSMVAWIPCQIVYFIYTGFSILSFITTILGGFCITMIVLLLSTILGFVVAKIAVKLKNRGILTALISLVVLGIYYLFYFNASSIFSNMMNNVLLFQRDIEIYAYPFYVYGNGCTGNLIYLLIIIVVVAILINIVWYFLKKNFIQLASSSNEIQNVNIKEGKKVTNSYQKALFLREWSYFKSSATYMLNCALGVVLIPIVLVYMYFNFDQFQQSINFLGLTMDQCIPLFVFGLCTLISMIDITAPSISLEGKNLWIIHSLPISSYDVIKSKIKFHCVVAGIPCIIGSIVMIIMTKCNIVGMIYLLMIPLVFVLFCALLGIVMNLMFPNLNWTNEIVPIKQSISVIVSLLIPLGIGIIGLLIYLLTTINEMICMLGFLVLLIIACGIMIYWIKQKGVIIFERL